MRLRSRLSSSLWSLPLEKNRMNIFQDRCQNCFRSRRGIDWTTPAILFNLQYSSESRIVDNWVWFSFWVFVLLYWFGLGVFLPLTWRIPRKLEHGVSPSSFFFPQIKNQLNTISEIFLKGQKKEIVLPKKGLYINYSGQV